jgi:Protein of unknown function (DUF3551)
MKGSIRHGLFSSMILLALGIGLDCTTSTDAQSYSVCLSGGNDGTLRCDYATMDQCRMAASGGLGDCETDPFAVSARDSRVERLQSGLPHHLRSRSRLAP